MNYRPVAIQKTVTTAGTRVQVSTDALLNVRSAVVQALATNTGVIYVGGSNVDSTHGVTLQPGESITLEVEGDHLNLSSVYIDAATNGDKANVIYAARF